MNILGIGVVFAQGFGVAALERALLAGWQKPGAVEVPHHAGVTRPAYQVNLDAAPDKTLLKLNRRADKLSKMAVLAAADALADSGIDNIAQKKIGIILATAFGPHVTTFAFLDDILDYGDTGVSPTTFSNSVHNAATSYIATSLKIKGPTLTVTQFRFSFQTALQLAEVWLAQGRCDYVLVGAVDQYGEVLDYVSDHKLTTAPDGKIRPFTFKPTCQVPGEGAAFFLMSRAEAGNTYCAVNNVFINDDPECGKTVDLNIIDADGMLPDESAYRASLAPEIPVAGYAPLFGSMMIGSAFNLAAAALMLQRQTRFAAPVQDNPHGIRLLTESGAARIGTIRCIGANCFEEKAVIYLSRDVACYVSTNSPEVLP
jgi:3-oxoacyl-[acyl-carrier-protein] synthase II